MFSIAEARRKSGPEMLKDLAVTFATIAPAFGDELDRTSSLMVSSEPIVTAGRPRRSWSVSSCAEWGFCFTR